MVCGKRGKVIDTTNCESDDVECSALMAYVDRITIGIDQS